MSTYLAIYFAVCAYSLSIAMAERSSNEEWWRYPIHVILAPMIAPFVVIWLHVALPISDKLDGFFQIKTWLRYVFDRKSLKRTTEELDTMAAVTRMHKMTNHPGHIGWRAAFRAVCRVNGYKFDQSTKRGEAA